MLDDVYSKLITHIILYFTKTTLKYIKWNCCHRQFDEQLLSYCMTSNPLKQLFVVRWNICMIPVTIPLQLTDTVMYACNQLWHTVRLGQQEWGYIAYCRYVHTISNRQTDSKICRNALLILLSAFFKIPTWARKYIKHPLYLNLHNSDMRTLITEVL